PEAKVVGVGLAHRAPWCGLHDVIGDAVALGVSHGLLLRIEGEADLRFHVARAGPAHQRIDLAGRLRFVFEHPFLGAGWARVHGGLGMLVDAGDHRVNPWRRSGVDLASIWHRSWPPVLYRNFQKQKS